MEIFLTAPVTVSNKVGNRTDVIKPFRLGSAGPMGILFAHTKPETELKPALRAQLNETVFVRKKRSVCFLISIFLNPELVNLLQGRSSVPVFGSV